MANPRLFPADDDPKEKTVMEELFGDLVSSYTRRQAIDDGLLVQLSGPGYEGDPEIPVMVHDAGFRCSLAMTIESFDKCVAPVLSDEDLDPDQSLTGRLWDVLSVAMSAIHVDPNRQRVSFTVRVVPNGGGVREFVALKAVAGVDDDGHSPAITIMLQEQD